jgi:prophage antirepressor-like protein
MKNNEMNEKKDMQVSEQIFEESKIRIAGTAEKPLFAAKDVCDVLGVKNPTQAVAALDEDERAMLNIGRQGEANFVTESGLYHLIFKSRKPAAKKFRRWVTDEVLPTLRKKGRYVVDSPAVADRDLLTLPEWLMEVAGVNPGENAWAATILIKRAKVAAQEMDYAPEKSARLGGLMRFPRVVLNYAAGMVKAEATLPANASWVGMFGEEPQVGQRLPRK